MNTKRLIATVMLGAFLFGMTSCNTSSGSNGLETVDDSVSFDLSPFIDEEKQIGDSVEDGSQSEENQAEESQTAPVCASTEKENSSSVDEANTTSDLASADSSTAEEGYGMTEVHIGVGDQTFPAQFYDNETAQAFLDMMPMTLDMSDLNRNEKMVYLPENLPTGDTERPGTIHTGEIMLYYDNCVVLFYETFPNSYGGYTRLGVIEDTAGLVAAVGSGNISVTFSVA